MSVTFVKTNYEVIKETKYLRFTKLERVPSMKTDIVVVDNIKRGITLGQIRWYSPWRQYCFMPWYQTVWNKGCLEDVYEVIEDLTEQKKLES